MLASLLSVGWTLTVSAGSAGDRPLNPGFEESAEEQEEIPGWFVPGSVRKWGYRAELVQEAPHAGERCARLWYDGKEPEHTQGQKEGFGNLMQTLDASSWRGKGFRLRAAAHVKGLGSSGELWFRVDRPGGARGFSGGMKVHSSEWRTYEIKGKVEADAEHLAFGLTLFGQGQVFLDEVELEEIELAPPEPARPLEDRGLENLVAFARLFGYVRHFHPSDEVDEANWEELAIAGVRAVEGATDCAELADELGKHFELVAPTVQVYPAGKAPAKPAALLPPVSGEKVWLRAWKHRGFGTGQGPSTYWSWREKERMRDGKLPDGCRDPAQTLEVDLGGGVCASIPLALYADGEGTLPDTTGSKSMEANARPREIEAPLFSGDDRATRLGDVVLAWNVFQHFYPYFDVVETDWAKELESALRSAAEDESERAFLETLRRLVAALRDGHGDAWFSRDEPTYLLPFSWDWVESELVITHVPERVGQEEVNPPGLARGSVVLAIDGVPTAQAFERASASISGASSQWIRRQALHALAAGRKDSEVTLDVRSPDGSKHAIACTRSATSHDVEEPRPEKIAELEPGLFYVDLDRITDKDFEEALPRLEHARGIVFDLRGYPNVSTVVLAHLIDERIQCARWNIPVLTLPDREGWSFDESGRWWVEPKQPQLKARTAFLTDGRAISYAETYLGMVEHYGLAEVVGGPTAGTNGNVNSFRLPGGYSVSWTGMKVLKHDGSRHHGIGIQPTVPCSRTIAGVTAGRDEILERGLAIVRE